MFRPNIIAYFINMILRTINIISSAEDLQFGHCAGEAVATGEDEQSRERGVSATCR